MLYDVVIFLFNHQDVIRLIFRLIYQSTFNPPKNCQVFRDLSTPSCAKVTWLRHSSSIGQVSPIVTDIVRLSKPNVWNSAEMVLNPQKLLKPFDVLLHLNRCVVGLCYTVGYLLILAMFLSRCVWRKRSTAWESIQKDMYLYLTYFYSVADTPASIAAKPSAPCPCPCPCCCCCCCCSQVLDARQKYWNKLK